MKKQVHAFRPSWMILLTLVVFACEISTPTPAPLTCTLFPEILQPSDGATVLLGTTIDIVVSVPYKALEIKINGTTVLENVLNGKPITWEYAYPWTPTAAGTYVIYARSTGYTCEYGCPPAYYCSEGTSDKIEVIVPDACLATSSANLYCRQGPDIAYEAIDDILPGQTMPVTGQSPDGKYLYLIGPNINLPCTVPQNSEYIQLSGACQALPIFTPEPTPVPPPTEKTRSKPPECNDAEDNDGDRLIDMSDPQCRNPEDNSESTP